MDLVHNLNNITIKSSELEQLKTSSEDIYNELNSCYLSNMNSTELNSYISKIKQPVERLKKGCTNTNTWLKNYLSELSSLEGKLASLNGNDLTSPTEFKGEFIDLFGKKTMPIIKNGVEEKKEEQTGESGVLSYKVGDLPEPGSNLSKLGKRATLLDVQVDGTSLGQDGTIKIKKGQTVKLTVKVPDEIPNVEWLKRTSADGAEGWSGWVSQKNYPNVNRNDSSTFVKTREYTWYITGNKTTDNITLSQTVFFSVPNAKYDTYKGMVRVRVNVVD